MNNNGSMQEFEIDWLALKIFENSTGNGTDKLNTSATYVTNAYSVS